MLTLLERTINIMQYYLAHIYNKVFFLINLIIIRLLKFKKRPTVKRSLLMIRLDRLGDYILFRNFIEVTSKSRRYNSYKIYLCGNEDWKELSEELDSDFIEDFIWVNRNKFLFNIFYKWEILSKIYNYGFDIAIESTYSREHLFGDTIIAASNAPNRIGSFGELIPKINYKRELVTNKFYTLLFNTGEENIFEFYRNKIFFEKLLGEKILIFKPNISINFSNSESILSFLDTLSNLIIISPGASRNVRKWSTKNYCKLIKFIISKSDRHIIIVGAKKDKIFNSNIMQCIGKTERATDLTGKTNLINLSQLISSSLLIITQDSAPLHLSMALNKKTICISNGFHFGRFVPYPSKISNNCKYVFPNSLRTQKEEKLRFGSLLNINEISALDVFKQFKKFL